MDVGEFSERGVYAGLRLDYRFRMCTAASRAISAAAELPVNFCL